MDTKILTAGIIGLILGGLVVSVAATQGDKPVSETPMMMQDMSMGEMNDYLKNKQGDEYDAAFINAMIEHHEGALDMARLSAERAKHGEIKQLSNDIIKAQEAEIAQMKQWQRLWNYENSSEHMMH